MNQAVKRNIQRFPEDLMFQISEREADHLVSQNVIPRKKHLGGSLPYAFTEQGVSMLSSILKSEQAIKINIAIILTFVSLREFLSFNKELGAKLSLLEKRIEKHDEEIKAIFGAIRQLMAPAEAKKKGGDRDFEGERIHSSFAPAAPENVPSTKISAVRCMTDNKAFSIPLSQYSYSSIFPEDRIRCRYRCPV